MCYNGFVKLARSVCALRTMRPRHAVLLTPSISARLPQLLSYKQIALESPQFLIFVFKRLHALSFFVFCKSCVCHSCENLRVGTPTSPSFSPSPSSPQTIHPSFHSLTYHT